MRVIRERLVEKLKRTRPTQIATVSILSAMLPVRYQFSEDPSRPEHLLVSRESFEIDVWIARRERDCWLRLFAFQVMFGSLVWAFLFC